MIKLTDRKTGRWFFLNPDVVEAVHPAHGGKGAEVLTLGHNSYTVMESAVEIHNDIRREKGGR